jgi:predicted RNA-binding Zn-ribbon protein involved in translation (DUF1610 family)
MPKTVRDDNVLSQYVNDEGIGGAMCGSCGTSLSSDLKLPSLCPQCGSMLTRAEVSAMHTGGSDF